MSDMGGECKWRNQNDEFQCVGEHESAKQVLSSELFLAHAGDGHGGNALLATDKTKAFVGSGLDSNLIRLNAERGGDVLLHGGSVWFHSRSLGDERRVHVFDAHAFFPGDLGALFENFEAADAFDAGVAGRKPMTDVGLAECTENCIRDGVAEYIGIRMPLQATAVWNGDAPKHERAAFLEGMNVVADADSHVFRSRFAVLCCLRVVVCGFFQAGEHVGDLEVDALAVEEVADLFEAGFGEVVEGRDEMLANANGTVRVRAEDDGNFALGHHAQHLVSGIHLGITLVEARRVQFHGDASGGDAVERGGDRVLDDGKAPRVRVIVFHQVGMREAVVEAGLSGLGEVIEVSAAEVLDGACFELVEVFLGLPMHGPQNVVELSPLMQLGDVVLVAGEVFAFDAEANVELAFEGVGSSLDEGDIGVEFALRHADRGPEAVWHRAVAGENDALEAGFQRLLGVFFGLAPSVFAQGGVHVGVIKEGSGFRGAGSGNRR